MARRDVLLMLGSLLLVTLFSGGALVSTGVSADDIIDQININVPISCSMSGVGVNSHNSNVYNGIYTSDIGTTTIDVFCNDGEGFSIYAIGFTGDQYSGDDHTKLIGASTNEKIVTGTATATGNPDVSNWAMKLSTTTSPTPAYPITIVNSFNNYHVVPDTYTKVATRTSATDVGNNATGSELTTTYAAYMSKTQSADTYTGKVKYTLVHPANEIPAQPKDCASGYICYFPNTNIVEGTMGRQAVTSSNTTAKLFAANFSKTGYGFAGWSDAYDYKTNNNAHFYGPNETISFTAGDYTGSNPGLSLYAVWVKSEGFFQDSSKTTSVCNGLAQASVNGARTLNSVSALTDNRDNQTYAIAKLADGKCWMIENLRLDNTAELTTLNTNNPLNDGTKVTIKHNYIDTQTYSTLSATSSVAYDATSAPNGWCSTSSTPCDDQSRLRTDNTANRTSYTATSSMSTSDNLYSYGNYYNWYSATAGRGTYDFDTDNVSTTGDLCPNGWKLPRGGDKTKIESNHDNDFWNLVVDVLNGGVNPANYTSTTMPYYDGTAESSPVDLTIRTYPNNFLHSGTTDGASISFRGTLGYYWSSTAYSPNTAYAIYYLNSSVRPGTANSYKYGGWSIRCLFQPN